MTNTATLTIHSLGTTDATTTEHLDADAARAALATTYGESVRERDEFTGVIGTMTGRVFQASSTYRIGRAVG